MPNHVCMGALLQCSFGVAPSSMVVLPANKMLTTFVPAANIMDNKPMVNIMPFGDVHQPGQSHGSTPPLRRPRPRSGCLPSRRCPAFPTPLRPGYRERRR